MNHGKTTVFHFPGYCVDPTRGLLRDDGVDVPLRAKSLDLLLILLRNAGRVVSKEELLEKVWNGLAVSEDSLTQCIHDIRRALADTEQKLIRTVPRRGYLFPSEALITGKPEIPAHPSADHPSIAVLSFSNLTNDPAQDYFADGIVEEIIMSLSRMKWIFVIARNSSFIYKGRAVDIKQVGRELGVRYVLEGSVRRAENRVRIAGQLIDTSTGATIWADRFDGELADIFDLQDQVTASVVGAISPKLMQAEIERSRHKPTDSLDAYDYYLRGMAAYQLWSREGNREALTMFTHATELDPHFASAFGMAARCYAQLKAGGWPSDWSKNMPEAARLARRAAALGNDDALALCTAGFALAWVAGEVEEGTVLIDEALRLNPNLAWAWVTSAWARVWLGEPETATVHLARAMRLSPLDPLMLSTHTVQACAHMLVGRHEEAFAWAVKAWRQRPDYGFVAVVATTAAALAGRQGEAEKALARLRTLMPDFHISNLQELFPLRRTADVEIFSDGLRRAGLPE
jgi:TolB-like protein